MEEREIDVLEYVEADIKAVLGERDFDTLEEEARKRVIEDLEARWTSPDNEVVKRMAHFEEKSPDILKVVMTS